MSAKELIEEVLLLDKKWDDPRNNNNFQLLDDIEMRLALAAPKLARMLKITMRRIEMESCSCSQFYGKLCDRCWDLAELDRIAAGEGE